jgi:hypothetical protein
MEEYSIGLTPFATASPPSLLPARGGGANPENRPPSLELTPVCTGLHRLPIVAKNALFAGVTKITSFLFSPFSYSLS